MEWSQLRGNFRNESDKVWLHMSDGEVVYLMGRNGESAIACTIKGFPRACLRVEEKKII